MKLAISNIAWSAEDDETVYALMQKYGYTGLEIAPTRVFSEQPYMHIDDAKNWGTEFRRQYGFEIPSMQSIWFGRTERIFGSETERQILLDYTRQAINFAAALQCGNLVFGCPRNRYKPEGAGTDQAITFFREIAQYASEHGVVIGMEANPPIYHTNYINTTQEALQLIEEVASDGFQLNLDVGTMLYNHETVGELAGKVQYIHHVHISEPQLLSIKQRKMHQELADCLRKEGYQGFVSIEMGRQDDVKTIEEVMQAVGEVFG